MNVEQWAPVLGWEGHFEVSDLGRVHSLTRQVPDPRGWTTTVNGKVRRPYVSHRGYLVVGLTLGQKRTLRPVHHLVLEAFAGPRPDGQYGCHSDGNPMNNQRSNLRWGTPSSNSADRVRHGRHYLAGLTHCNRGHEFTDENTRLYRGRRCCLACERARGAEKRQRRRGCAADAKASESA